MASDRKPGDFIISRDEDSGDDYDEHSSDNDPTRIGFRGGRPDEATVVRNRPVVHAPFERQIRREIERERQMEEEPERRRRPRTPSPAPARELSGTLSARSLLRVVKTEPTDTKRDASPLPLANEHDQEIYRELRTSALFDGLPNDILLAAIHAGELEILHVERDESFIDPTTLKFHKSRVFFVLSGQVSMSRFPDGLLEERRAIPEKLAKKKAAHEPMIRLAEKHLATFNQGEIFGTQVMPEGDHKRTAFFAVEPSRVMSFDKQRLADLMKGYPFFQKRIRRAADLSRERLAAIHGIKAEVLDFFVRHGLSVAGTLRVRQIDRCIECKACEIACEERYGYKRLTINGPRLGMLDFVQTCRTCVDKRCLEGCSYDAIAYDEKKGEVVINEANCTGTGVCAALCPYGAIEMVDMGNCSPLFFDRMKGLDAFNKKKPKLRRMASKCDHCSTYNDQACISHCPTGALIEISPNEIFRDEGAIAKLAAQAGYDHTVHLDIEKVLPTQAFQKGLNITTGAQAKLPDRKVSPSFYWSAGLVLFFICMAEIVLRRFVPQFTLAYLYNIVCDGMDPELARTSVDFKAGSDFAVNCGYFGTFLLLLTMLYVVRKHMRFLHRFGTNQSWFDFHLFCGIMGPAFILLHTALKLDNWVSFAFWSMVLTMLSGIMGRFLFVQLPKLDGRDLDQMEHERALAKLRQKNPKAVAVIDDEIADFIETVRGVIERRGIMGSLLFVLADELGRPYRAVTRRLRVGRRSMTRTDASHIARRGAAIRLLERRRVLTSRAKDLLSAWKKVHVPFTIIMAILVTIHVILAFKYSL